MSKKEKDYSNTIWITILAIIIALAFIFPGKSEGLWIFGFLPLAGFLIYLVYAYENAKIDFKENRLEAIGVFLFTIFLGGGLLALSLMIFGII